jgi:tRNA(Ile)-lysidine synthase
VSLDRRFAEAMGQLIGPDFPTDIALAVSGGGDSMAMLYLAHNWSHVWGVRLWVVTVDHGLRPEAAAEAAMVADECAALGWPHATLRWHWDGQGNLMDAARRGRLEVIDRWRRGLEHVLMAHTREDLAETFLMRLKRGSGVEGLAAMQTSVDLQSLGTGGSPMAARDVCWSAPPPMPSCGVGDVPACSNGFRLLRPCLDMRREELRHYLRTLHGRWVDDPSNDNPRFDRVRVRQAMSVLRDMGLDADTLVDTAQRMSRARDALRARARQVWNEIGQEERLGTLDGQPADVPTGDILFDRNGFEQIERDTQMRLLAAALQYVSGAAYRPRARPLQELVDRLLSGGSGTLHGCEARMGRETLRVFREFSSVRDLRVPHRSSQVWDGRWRVNAPTLMDRDGVEIRALGEDGWAQLAAKPRGAPPFHAARSLPALWQGNTLLACDALGIGPGRTAKLWPMGQEAGSLANLFLPH